MDFEGVSKATARRRFKRYVEIGLLVKNPNAKRSYLEGRP